MYDAFMPGRPFTKPSTANGARLRALREAAGLSQIQLATQLDVPQRTLSFYEREAEHLPSSLLPRLSQVLGVSVEAILGMQGAALKKRGPKSKLERQLEAVASLPRHQQQKISDVVEALVAQTSVRRAG